MPLQDLRPPALRRSPDELLSHLQTFQLDLKFSAGVWFFSPAFSRFHARYQPELDIRRRLKTAPARRKLAQPRQTGPRARPIDPLSSACMARERAKHGARSAPVGRVSRAAGRRPESDASRLLPAVVAHRTACRLAPENSLEGIQLCIDRGYDWVEMDVRAAGDGCLILSHAPLEAIEGAAALHPGRSAGRSRPPALREALELACGRIGVYLDCRRCEPADVLREVGDFAHRGELMACVEPQYRAELHARSRGAIRVVHDLPTWRIAATCGASAGALVLELLPHQASADFVAQARTGGSMVGWVTLGRADTPENWRSAALRGASWVMTDYPDELTAARRTWSPAAPG